MAPSHVRKVREVTGVIMVIRTHAALGEWVERQAVCDDPRHGVIMTRAGDIVAETIGSDADHIWVSQADQARWNLTSCQLDLDMADLAAAVAAAGGGDLAAEPGQDPSLVHITLSQLRSPLAPRQWADADLIGMMPGDPVVGDKAAALATLCGRPDLGERLRDLDQVQVAEVGRRRVDFGRLVRPSHREISIARWETATGPLWHVSDGIADWGGADASVWVDAWVVDVDPTTPEGILNLINTKPRGCAL